MYVLLIVFFFRNLYLGETFLCYIYLKNESPQTIHDIMLKAEIDTATSHIPILGPKAFSKLDPYASIDVIVKHEVKEHGSVKYESYSLVYLYNNIFIYIILCF